MKKVPVYYTTVKPSERSNYRAYFISRWVGIPFLKFRLPSDFEAEKISVAEHLGLFIRDIEWRSHRGHNKGSGS